MTGTNPLAFLAALGVQVAFAPESDQPRLWWSEDLVPHAIVDEDFPVERIADQSMQVFALWKDSPAVRPRRPDGSTVPKGDELKLTPEDLRSYLALVNRGAPGKSLTTALVAEGSLDRKGDVAKPSDLYFTAGNQKFLTMVRQILEGVSKADLLTGLTGPWGYASKMPSLMWDTGDDRLYALRADDPAKDKKLTNPGPEALAVLGLSTHAVFGGRNRTLTQGCSGSWKAGTYSWPLWRKPASLHAVKSLLTHASARYATTMERQRWFPSWGVFKIYQSSIRRSGQGGSGTFGPPSVSWQAT